MKLTKYGHACFTVEKDAEILVVDPGGYSPDFITPNNVCAIVITHEHADHFDEEQITAIMDKNPNATIVAHPSITNRIEAFNHRAVNAGDTVEIGNFTLQFFGGNHAVIHSSIPVIPNLGVLINDLLYYPGDSFTLPGKSVDTLALPAAAPWMNIGQAMDFLDLAKPRFAFPTHDAILSELGKELVDTLLSVVAEKNGTTYDRIRDNIEI